VTSCIVDSAAIYIMVVKFRNSICPLQPQLSLHRRAALSSDSNGARSYIAERTQSTVYIVRCLLYGCNPHGPCMEVTRSSRGSLVWRYPQLITRPELHCSGSLIDFLRLLPTAGSVCFFPHKPMSHCIVYSSAL
jgi:hypothetical protein